MSTRAFGRPATDAIAVVGACVPERREYARRLAAVLGMTLVPSQQIDGSPNVLESALTLDARIPGSAGVLLEYPMEHSAPDIIGELTDPQSGTTLREMVCVVDASHLVTDLRATGFLPVAGEDDDAPVLASRAELIVTQIEFASAVVLTNVGRLGADDRALMTALVSHLSPHARLDLSESTRTVGLHGQDRGGRQPAYTQEQTRPGWVSLLNGEFDPVHRHQRVSALHYEQPRPFHPRRLGRLLDEHLPGSAQGRLLRSVGFCHMASRPHVTAQWDHVGDTLSLSPAALDHRLTEHDEVLAFGQDLALIGLDLDVEGLLAELDAATLTDAELMAGPQVWTTFEDPFPEWHNVDG